MRLRHVQQCTAHQDKQLFQAYSHNARWQYGRTFQSQEMLRFCSGQIQRRVHGQYTYVGPYKAKRGSHGRRARVRPNHLASVLHLERKKASPDLPRFLNISFGWSFSVETEQVRMYNRGYQTEEGDLLCTEHC